MRVGKVKRRTKETEVDVRLNLDGSGKCKVNTSVKFFDHLLSSLAKHGCFDLDIMARGDFEHHVVEDVMISLGSALQAALGKGEGIRRMGDAVVPMDDSLALVAVDLSGRAYTELDIKLVGRKLGDLSTDMISHALQSFATSGKFNLHAQVLRGYNDHHKAEAIFKALGVALMEAVKKEPRKKGVPSTKGKIQHFL